MPARIRRLKHGQQETAGDCIVASIYLVDVLSGDCQNGEYTKLFQFYWMLFSFALPNGKRNIIVASRQSFTIRTPGKAWVEAWVATPWNLSA